MILLYNANVVDGSGSSAYLATLVLDQDQFSDRDENRIIRIIKQSKVIRNDDPIILSYSGTDAINFHSDYLIPGFIDAHCHSEMLYLKNPATRLRRDDYISSEICGNCGISLYPISSDTEKFNSLKLNVLSILGSWDGFDDKWNSFAEFRDIVQSKKFVNKLFFQVGHSALRIAAMDGSASRKASKSEVMSMCSMLSDALSEGCIGLSTGLYYDPCVFADEYEILELLNLVRSSGKVFSIHRREEGNGSLSSLQEAIDFSKKSSVKLQVSHLKAIGERNQDQVDDMLRLIDRAHEDGVDIAFDCYPYTYGSTSLSSLLPPSVLSLGESEWRKRLCDRSYRKEVIGKIEGAERYDSIIELCGFDDIFIQSCDEKRYIDKSINEIASEDGKNAYDAFFDILLASKGPVLMRDTTQSQESLLKIMSHPLSLYGTDALYAGSNWHPRSTRSTRDMLREYSTFIGIEKLVARATLKTANRFDLDGDYKIQEGSSPVLIRLPANCNIS